MQAKIHLSGMVMAAALLAILAGGCASAPAPTPSSPGSKSGIYVEQVPITNYMRSQEGTPNELSPLAPPQGRNVRKVGGHWLCEIDGQTVIFNSASSCWEPRQQ